MSRQTTRRRWLTVLAVCITGAMIGVMAQVLAQGAPVDEANRALRVDATAPIPPAGPAGYRGGASRAPDGSTIGVTSRYLTLNGRPWLPVMGEMHYSRVPESEWEDDILRMKSAGVDIISTYVIWIHHEEIEGQWDWTGQRDLRHFAELCQRHGMLLYPRIGPWAHAEARNGGLPDWVVAGGPIRQIDPKFMAETGTLYSQAGAQLHGLFWKDGGPVIGVQIENEYSARGPNQGEKYLLALKKMAIASGFDVPLYTVTGWDNAVAPPHEFLPVYGGYPDAPWGPSRTALPPQEVYVFRFGSRISGNMGMIGAAAGAAQPPTDEAPQGPFITAEVGGGMQDTYHRRLVMSADDIAAMMPVMIGSGVNLYGSYMFAGGQNPDGRLTTLEESQATHYPTDVPQKSYDFQAPIGEYGLERLSLRRLKNWNYFLNDFGALLAPMPAFAPEVLPSEPTDLGPLRWSVRTDGQAGFLFVNNYARGAAMPARPHTRFTVLLPGGRTVQVPAKPVDLPPGVYFAWPFGLDLDGLRLRYGTAQLMARLHGAAGASFVFTCVRGVPCEVALEGEALLVQASPNLRVERREGATILTRMAPDQAGTPEFDDPATIRTSSGVSVRLLLLSPEAADDAWKVASGGEPELLLTPADVFAGETGVTLRQLGDPAFHFALYPAASTAPRSNVPVSAGGNGTFAATLPRFGATVATAPLKQAGAVPPVRLGASLSWRPAGVAQAPSEATWTADAARWSLNVSPAHLPPNDPSGVSNLFLRIDYAGDAARLASNGKLLDDDFFNGEPWLLGLRRYTRNAQLPPLELEILPLRRDAPIYLPPAASTKVTARAQTVELDGVSILAQYQIKLEQVH